MKKKQKQVCSSASYWDGNVRWPRRVLPPGESRSVYTVRPINIEKKMGQTDRRTDPRPMHYTYR